MSKKFAHENEDQKCALSKEHTEGTCFSLESLCRMVAAWNIKCATTKHGTPITIREHKGYLVTELTKALSDVCNDQLCWLEQDFIKALNDAEIDDNTFLPKISQGKFVWLNTTNIKQSMEQQETIYPDFKFLGCVPIDFDSLPQYGIRDMNLDELYLSGIRRMGIIFNLDEHWQGGSHWVSMFMNLKKNQVYFFDSCGKKPVKRIRDLVNRISTWCYHRNIKKSRKKLEDSSIEDSFMGKEPNFIEKRIKSIKYNTDVHQQEDSECGVYSINFIRRMNKGETFEHICDNPTDDAEMNECRKIYFRFK
jgi:hypothetical protein